MKTLSFDQAIEKYEVDLKEDLTSFQNHTYSGYVRTEGTAKFEKYLGDLYVKFYNDIQNKFENILTTQNLDIALKFLESKINSLENKKKNFDLNNSLKFWTEHKVELKTAINTENINNSLNTNIKNQYETESFFIEMIGTQNFYFKKALDELNNIYESYCPPVEYSISEKQINKELWDKTLSNENDILSTSDLARIFKKDARTINRWVKEGALRPINKNKRPHQFNKNEIKEVYLRIRNL